MSILLEESVDTRNTTVPRVFQVFQGKSSVLSGGFLSLKCVLSPDTLRVNKFLLPRQDVSVQVRNKVILFMAQTTSEVSWANIGLLGIAEVRLRDENMSHREHSKTSQLLWSVKDHRRESARHLRVETNLDTGLDLVFTLDQHVKELLSVDGGFSEVGHEANQSCVPLVDDLGESGGTRSHQNHTDTVFEASQRFVIDTKEGLSGSLFGSVVLQVPNTIFGDKLLHKTSRLGENSDFETAHVEEQVRVVLAVDGHKALLPFDSGEGTRKAILDLPEDGSSKVDIVLHKSHTSISWPALLVVVPHNVFVVRVRVLCQVSLDKISGFIVVETVENVQLVNVSAVQSDWVLDFGLSIVEGQELVWHLRRASKLG
mmetsp:Transcript_13888/g.19295  ORF Transcript_13888/g.19295 Transcript_13888/m.19295 type:complete len:371 (-) Transcript_13888:1044-2156(-)